MSPRREKRVTYYEPGAFLAEEYCRRIEDGPDIIDRAARGATGATFCFHISTVIVADPIPDGEGGELRVLPKTVEVGPKYYLGGDVFTPAEVEELPGDHKTLLANMRGNGWARVIRTRMGNWQPLADEDVVLPAADKVGL